MLTNVARTLFVVLCFSPIAPAAAQGRTLCAVDSLNNTVVIKTDTDFAADAIIGLHGLLAPGQATIPVSGTALVDSAGAVATLSLQGINNGDRHQHVGIAVVTDFMLNGAGTFDNVNAGRPFTYEIIAVTWTALDPCPGPPQVARFTHDSGPTESTGTVKR